MLKKKKSNVGNIFMNGLEILSCTSIVFFLFISHENKSTFLYLLKKFDQQLFYDHYLSRLSYYSHFVFLLTKSDLIDLLNFQ